MHTHPLAGALENAFNELEQEIDRSYGKYVSKRRRGNLERLVVDAPVSSLPVGPYREVLGAYLGLAKSPARRLKERSGYHPERLQKEQTYASRVRWAYEELGGVVDKVAIGALATMTAFTQLHHGVTYAYPLLASTCMLMWNRAKENRALLDPLRLSAYAVSLVPAAQFFAQYLLTGDAQAKSSAIAYSHVPRLMAVMGIAVPWAFQRARSELVRAKVDRLTTYLSVAKETRHRFERIDSTLKHVVEFQQLPAAVLDVRPSIIEEYDALAARYLEGKCDELALIECRRSAMRDLSTLRKGLERLVEPSLMEQAQRHTPHDAAPAQAMESESYRIITSFGVPEEDARRIERAVDAEQIGKTVLQLRSVFGDRAEQVVQSNPGLLLLRNSARDEYFVKVYRTLELLGRKYGPVLPEAVSPEANPNAFATRDGLQYLAELVDAPQRPPIADALDDRLGRLRERYRDPQLVRAILQQGFALDSNSPRIGMRYRHFDYIKSMTSNDAQVTGESMKRFNKTFGQLIADGAILTEKEYKGGGGKFSGCYSVTPSLDDIRGDALRALVRHFLYER